MTTVLAISAALLAVGAGVLLAAFEQPRATVDATTRRVSLVLVVATSLTAAAGAAYAFLA